MKQILFGSFLLLSLSVKSQVQDTSASNQQKMMFNAGRELIKYQHQFVLGTGLELTGAIIAVAGSASTDATSSKPVVAIGAGISVIGFILTIASVTHIGRAGLILKGNSIAIPLGRHRKA